MRSLSSAPAVAPAPVERSETLRLDETALITLKIGAIAASVRRLLQTGARTVSIDRLGSYGDADTCDREVEMHLRQATEGLGTHGTCEALNQYGHLVAEEHKHLFS